MTTDKGAVTLWQGDCLTLMDRVPTGSVDLILTDPPYFKVKGEAWDRQWDKPAAFLQWLDAVLVQFQRVLKPNGSLYLFASPKMSARVECLVSERFNVLNHIIWRKEEGRHKRAGKESLRTFFPQTERVIFAEHRGADSMALGESGYAAQCEKLHGFVFDPLRLYLLTEFQKAGWKGGDLNAICGTASMAARHYTARSQWALPTAEHYAKLQAAAPAGVLRREYEGLRREYEGLRRPFAVSPQTPYTDVWDFKTVSSYGGKHPCEKPKKMLTHIINASSRPGDVVLDAFSGGGSAGIACLNTGRAFIGIEKDEHYFNLGQQRIAKRQAELAASLFAESAQETREDL